MARRRNKSVITDDFDRCYLCKRPGPTEIHHIFGAAHRDDSEKYGLVVPLCHYCHNEPPYGVHFDEGVRLKLQAEAQERFETINDHKTFMEVFKRDYIGTYLTYLEEQNVK